MNSKIWLSPPHMGGNEQNHIKEAFDTNWIAPLGTNIIQILSSSLGTALPLGLDTPNVVDEAPCDVLVTVNMFIVESLPSADLTYIIPPLILSNQSDTFAVFKLTLFIKT